IHLLTDVHNTKHTHTHKKHTHTHTKHTHTHTKHTHTYTQNHTHTHTKYNHTHTFTHTHTHTRTQTHTHTHTHTQTHTHTHTRRGRSTFFLCIFPSWTVLPPGPSRSSGQLLSARGPSEPSVSVTDGQENVLFLHVFPVGVLIGGNPLCRVFPGSKWVFGAQKKNCALCAHSLCYHVTLLAYMLPFHK